MKSMRVVKYLWAAALSLGVVLFFCSIDSFVRVYFDKTAKTAENLLWGGAYALTALTLTRCAANGKGRLFLFLTIMLAGYPVFRGAECAGAAAFACAVMALITAFSAIIAVFTVKERTGGLLFIPVVVWHTAVLVMLLGAL